MILWAVLELQAKKHCQSSPFTAKNGPCGLNWVSVVKWGSKSNYFTFICFSSLLWICLSQGFLYQSLNFLKGWVTRLITSIARCNRRNPTSKTLMTLIPKNRAKVPPNVLNWLQKNIRLSLCVDMILLDGLSTLTNETYFLTQS